MPAWSLIVWLLIGAVVGLFARRFIGGTPPFGQVGDIILGIAGGVVGGYIPAILGISGNVGGLILTLITALLGASLMLWLSNRVKR
ncbi:MAG: GlsB/YeaQ/YmgE family stress response membrane protein [Thiotrichales bacterium]